jgi:hypothetical protein
MNSGLQSGEQLLRQHALAHLLGDLLDAPEGEFSTPGQPTTPNQSKS